MLFFSECIDEEKAERQKELLIASAHNRWQEFGDKISFNSYLRALGLVEPKRQLTKEEKEQLVKQAYDTADEVLEEFKKGYERVI